MTHTGGCHCGAVRFEVSAPAEVEVLECNCSICHKLGYLHLIVQREHFRLLRGEEALSTYTFNTGQARHLFCRNCGVESFYVPRSHPDGYSVNLRCLDEGTLEEVRVRPFDGRHWEEAAAALRR
jgi:hypothetical protein